MWTEQNFQNVEENIFYLQKMIWFFFKGKKYDKKSYMIFLGFLQKEFYEKECFLLDKEEERSQKEFTKEIFSKVMIKKFKNSLTM